MNVFNAETGEDVAHDVSEALALILCRVLTEHVGQMHDYS